MIPFPTDIIIYEPWNAFYSDNPAGDATLSDFNGSNVMIDAGDGDDSINNRGSNVTINAGGGDDYIYSSWENAETFIYSAGDGNDLISNFDSSDVLRINASSLATQISGNDFVINVGNKNAGSITLKGAAYDV